MIWANNLEMLHYYFIAAFILSYMIYQVRLFFLTGKRGNVILSSILKKLFIRSIYFTLIIVAVLGPSFGDIKKELKSEGKDIYILLDVSASMNAYDIPPSRLEKAKKELKFLIKNLRFNDRVGLVVFAESPYLQCPLTFDMAALQLYLESANTKLMPHQGTNLEDALEFSYQKHMQKNVSKDNPNSKVVLLVTDGEDASTGAYEAARKMKQNNIALFIAGIGTEEGSKIPVSPGFKKNEQGEYVISKLNKASLEKLASFQEDGFYEIGPRYSQTQELADKLNTMKGMVKEVKKIDLSSNKYYYFLAVALFFVIIDGLVTVNVIKI